MRPDANSTPSRSLVFRLFSSPPWPSRQSSRRAARRARPATSRAVVGFESNAELAQALKRFPGAKIVRRAAPHEDGRGRAARDARKSCAASAESPTRTDRSSARRKVEPALAAMFLAPGLPYEWQYVATRVDEVPDEILRRERDQDRGRRHRRRRHAPRPRREDPETWDIVHRRRTNVADRDGHGTFVSALAAGSVDQRRRHRRLRWRRQLLMVKAVGARQLQRRRRGGRDRLRGRPRREDHQPQHRRRRTSPLETRAIEYAASHERPPRRGSRQRVRRGQPRRVPGRGAPAGRLQGPGRLRPRRRGEHDGRASARPSRTPGTQISLAAPARTSSGRSPPARRASTGRATPLPGASAGSTAGRAARRSPPGGRRRGRARLGREPR